MKFLLRLKHWQIFLLTWGTPILINIFTFTDPTLMIKAFPVLMVFFLIGTYGWIWAIATDLNERLPDEVKLSKKKFIRLFSIPVIYIVFILIFMSQAFNFGQEFADNFNPAIFGLIIPLHLISIVIAIWGMTFAACTLKSIELGRKATFSDYAGEFFLIWFSPIGYWILQPRLNKIVEE